MLTLREMISQLPSNTLDKVASGIAIVICLDHSPLVVRTMDEPESKELFRLLSLSENTQHQVQ